jgi:hypothetical protein
MADELDDFVCNIEVKPVADWVEDEEAEGCPECLIKPLSSFYLGVLEKEGEEKLAEELKAVFKEGDVLTISKKLDSIKTDAGKALRKQLRNLDCFAQTFKPEA